MPDAELPAKRKAFRDAAKAAQVADNPELPPKPFEYPPELGPSTHIPGVDDETPTGPSRGIKGTLDNFASGAADAIMAMPAGFAARANQAAGMPTGLMAIPAGVGLDLLGGGTEHADAASKLVADSFGHAKRLAPKADAGFGEQVGAALGGLAFDMPVMMASGGTSTLAEGAAVAPSLWRGVFGALGQSTKMSVIPSVTSGAQTAIDVLDAGGSAAGALAAGAVEAGANAVSNVLPLNAVSGLESAAGRFASRAAQGAGSNVVADASATIAVNPMLPDSIQRDPFDAQQQAGCPLIDAPDRQAENCTITPGASTHAAPTATRRSEHPAAHRSEGK